eukprot:scpid108041/ scgid14640/ 
MECTLKGKAASLVAGTLFIYFLATTCNFRSSSPAVHGWHRIRSRWRPPDQKRAADKDTAGGYAKHIRKGSMAYLILGEAKPAQKWVRRSRWPRASVLYASWKENLSNITWRPGFHYYYLPNTTWTTARNRQMEL